MTLTCAVEMLLELLVNPCPGYPVEVTKMNLMMFDSRWFLM
jgi:hypothetical protein